MSQVAVASPFVGISSVAEDAGLRLSRVGRSPNYKTDCPFCGDVRKNLEVNIEKDVFHCWACGTSGGVIRFYALLHDVSEHTAKETLYPQRSGKPRFYHPALDLKREELESIGIRTFPRMRPSMMSNHDWFQYKKRTLDWIWMEWKRHEAVERDVTNRLMRLLETVENKRRNHA